MDEPDPEQAELKRDVDWLMEAIAYPTRPLDAKPNSFLGDVLGKIATNCLVRKSRATYVPYGIGVGCTFDPQHLSLTGGSSSIATIPNDQPLYISIRCVWILLYFS